MVVAVERRLKGREVILAEEEGELGRKTRERNRLNSSRQQQLELENTKQGQQIRCSIC